MELRAAAQQAQVPVFVITMVHSRDRSTWTLSMLEDDQGCLFSGDPGTELIHEIETEGTPGSRRRATVPGSERICCCGSTIWVWTGW